MEVNVIWLIIIRKHIKKRTKPRDGEKKSNEKMFDFTAEVNVCGKYVSVNDF